MRQILKSSDIKKIAIAYNSKVKNVKETLKILDKTLSDYEIYAEKFDIEKLKNGFDFVFVIGGDGTILKSARFYSKTKTPVFGINLGRLGYLSQSGVNDINKTIKKIFENKFKVEDRLMLEITSSKEKIIALNDFVIKSDLQNRTSKFCLNINDKFLCEYLADGLIISSPTGSTAYGLSAGGPVLSPKINAIEIVPICPHTLNARPLVIPADEKISIEGKNLTVIADGQNNFSFDKKVDIKMSKDFAKLALLNENEFYSILRQKLHWGVCPKK